MLVGVEHPPRLVGERLVEQLSCTDQGGAVLWLEGREQSGWAHSMARCAGRLVLLLEQTIEGTGSARKVRIVDARLMPEGAVAMRQRPDELLLTTGDMCTLNGRVDSMFAVIVRFGKNRKRADWRSGVQAAWGFDIKQGRIVSLPIRHVVCTVPEV